MFGRQRRIRARNRQCCYCEHVRPCIPLKIYPQDKTDVIYNDKKRIHFFICLKCFKGAENFKEDYIVWDWLEEE